MQNASEIFEDGDALTDERERDGHMILLEVRMNGLQLVIWQCRTNYSMKTPEDAIN